MESHPPHCSSEASSPPCHHICLPFNGTAPLLRGVNEMCASQDAGRRAHDARTVRGCGCGKLGESEGSGRMGGGRIFDRTRFVALSRVRRASVAVLRRRSGQLCDKIVDASGPGVVAFEDGQGWRGHGRGCV